MNDWLPPVWTPPPEAVGAMLGERPSVTVRFVRARADGKDVPYIANQAEYDQLPSGQHFIGPDNLERVKP